MRRFCFEYPKDYNGAAAVIRAGYSPKGAAVMATKLLNNPLIQATLGKLEREVMEECKIDVKEVLKHLYYLCTRVSSDFVDQDTGYLLPLNEMNERAQACIDGFEVTEEVIFGKGGKARGKLVKTKIRLSPKASGVDMALKHKGLYAAVKGEIEHTVNVLEQVLSQQVNEQGKSHLIEQKIKDVT